MSTIQPIIEAPYSETTHLPMSYDDYLLTFGEDERVEWANGEAILCKTPDLSHQSLVGSLSQLLGAYISVFKLGSIFSVPIEVKLWPDGPSREPDLVFLSTPKLDQLTEQRILGAPDLVIEIVSTDSARRDRLDKYDEHERAGIPEYWILDNRPTQNRAMFYQLAPDGQYQRVQIKEDGIYRSAVLAGFWLRVDWLWEEDLNFLPALAEIIGPDQLAEALRRSIERS